MCTIIKNLGALLFKLFGKNLQELKNLSLITPWRKNFKKQVKSKPNSEIKRGSFDLTCSTIKMTNNSSNNSRNNEKYGLSPVDCEIAAIAVQYEFSISTTDRNLSEFLEQKYDKKNTNL